MRFGFGHRKELPEPDSARIVRLLDMIKSLKPGELIEVIWIDASTASGRNIDSFKNQDFATYKMWRGYFCALVADHRYNQHHLILTTDGAKGRYHDIMTMPLAIIMSIKQYADKRGQVEIKGQRLPVGPMGWSEVKRLDGHGYKFVVGPAVKQG